MVYTTHKHGELAARRRTKFASPLADPTTGPLGPKGLACLAPDRPTRPGKDGTFICYMLGKYMEK